MKVTFARAFLASIYVSASVGSAVGQQPRLRGVSLTQVPSAAAQEKLPESLERTLQYFGNEGAAVDAGEDAPFESFEVASAVVYDAEVQAQVIENVDSRTLQQGPVMSELERLNVGYIQTVRRQRGLQTLTFSPDLVKEAQRWSTVMASQGKVSNRDPADANIALPWKRIGELPGKYNSVEFSGAVSHLKNHPILMDARYNRVGVGIVKSAKDGAYYMTILLKQV